MTGNELERRLGNRELSKKRHEATSWESRPADTADRDRAKTLPCPEISSYEPSSIPQLQHTVPRKSPKLPTEGALLEGGFEVLDNFLGEDIEISNITLDPLTP